MTHTKTEWSRRRPKRTTGWPAGARVFTITLGAGAAVVLAAAVVSRPSGGGMVTAPTGTSLTAALDRTITTEKAVVGESLTFTIPEPLRLDDRVTLPAGMALWGEVAHVRSGGRTTGPPELTLRFISLEVEGRSYRVSADPVRLRGPSDPLERAAETGAGVLGAGVVGLAAAVKGAAIEGGAGTEITVATKGNQIVLPTGQKLTVRLIAPLTLRYDGTSDKS